MIDLGGDPKSQYFIAYPVGSYPKDRLVSWLTCRNDGLNRFLVGRFCCALTRNGVDETELFRYPDLLPISASFCFGSREIEMRCSLDFRGGLGQRHLGFRLNRANQKIYYGHGRSPKLNSLDILRVWR